ncbi:MAG: hypothetical protein ACUVQZ_06715 [Candidatus Caldatribacteriaceae bacterium]
MKTHPALLFLFKVVILALVLFVISAGVSVLIGLEVPSEEGFTLAPAHCFLHCSGVW